jgi:hypothetical protein
MVYRKNLPMLERAVRALAGGGLAVTALLNNGFTPWGWIGVASGVFVALTGVVGFCPACWLVGRR